MEIYFHTGFIENPVSFMEFIKFLQEKYSLQRKVDKRFGGYVFYVSPEGVEMTFNSRYISLADRCSYEMLQGRRVIPESAPLRPLLEEIIKQFGPRRKIVTSMGENIEAAWLIKDLLPSARKNKKSKQ